MFNFIFNNKGWLKLKGGEGVAKYMSNYKPAKIRNGDKIQIGSKDFKANQNKPEHRGRFSDN